jgi:hypothetical protein
MVDALAVMTIRDEAVQLPHAVERLIADGLDVVVLDDGSEDDGVERLNVLRGNGLLEVRRRARREHMELSNLLEWEASVMGDYAHEWVLHVDADEWLQAQDAELRLIDLLREADRAGATAVNFEEFVFTPIDRLSEGTDPRRHMLEYYFFEPSKLRLMRAWRRDAALDNQGLAGHRLEGERLFVYPTFGVLRHYPIVTPALGLTKYRSRRYAATEVAKGWHRNRLTLVGMERIPRPAGDRLRRLDRWDSRLFDRSAPSRFHFWEDGWGRD